MSAMQRSTGLDGAASAPPPRTPAQATVTALPQASDAVPRTTVHTPSTSFAAPIACAPVLGMTPPLTSPAFPAFSPPPSLRIDGLAAAALAQALPLQGAQGGTGHLPIVASADSAKSLGTPDRLATHAPLVQGQLPALRDGEVLGEKHGSMPSSHPIATSPRAMLIDSTRRSDLERHQGPSGTAGPAATGLPPSGSAGSAMVDASSAAAAATGSSQPFLVSAHPNTLAGDVPPSDGPLRGPQQAAGSAASVSSSSVLASDRRPTTADLNARLQAQLKQSAHAHTHAQHHASLVQQGSERATIVELATCQCLVVDGRDFASGSPDALQLAGALALTNDSNALLAHMQAWMPALVSAAPLLAYTEPSHRRVHLNFTSSAALAAALSSAPLLVRCGSLPHSWPRNPLCCGRSKHEQPEMLQLSCVPAQREALPALASAVTALLSEMQLESTAHWHPTSSDPARNGMARIVINVLPRHASQEQVAATIARLHDKFMLWGGSVHLQAPNSPSLTRCRGCQQLGHVQELCPLYSGVGIRLLFKSIVSYHFMRQLQTQLGARAAYLGASADQHAPHRKVTLLFDGDESDSALMDDIISRMGTVLATFGSLVHESSVVKPRDRQRECKQCSSILKVHTCPFETQSSNIGSRSSGGQQQHRSSAAPSGGAHPRPPLAAAGAPRLPTPPSDPADRMCRSWRRTKTCPRKDQHRSCSFEHPAAHEPQRQVCFDFRDHGACRRGAHCNFQHAAPPAPAPARNQQQQADAPASMELDGAAAAAPAASAAAPAASAASASAAAPARRRSRADQAAAAESKQQQEDAAPAAAAASRTPAASPSRRPAPPAPTPRSGGGRSAAKRLRDEGPATSALAFPMSTTRWSEMQPDTEEEEANMEQRQAAATAARKGTPAASPPPSSSLGLLSSPSKRNKKEAAAAASSGTAPTRSSSTAAAAAKPASSSPSAASAAALSRSSSSAGPSQGL